MGPNQQQASPNYLNYEDQFNRSIQPLQSSLKPVGSTDNSVEV
jgi:hypothetical protein